MLGCRVSKHLMYDNSSSKIPATASAAVRKTTKGKPCLRLASMVEHKSGRGLHDILPQSIVYDHVPSFSSSREGKKTREPPHSTQYSTAHLERVDFLSVSRGCL